MLVCLFARLWAGAIMARYNERVYAAFLRELTLVPNVERACRVAGISPAAVYKRMEKQKTFKEKVVNAKECSLDGLEAFMFESGKEDIGAAKWLLAAHRKDIYGNKIEAAVSGGLDLSVVDRVTFELVVDDEDSA